MTNNNTTDPQNEVFDVVNENDEVVGKATRGEVHQNPNLIHRVIHIWILNDKSEILIQQRSLTKDKSSGKWDISCGGHIQKGHDPETTAERELQEELDVKADCKFITKFIERFSDQTEIVNLYYAIHNGPFKFPKEEINQVKFFSKDEALKFIKNDPDASYFSKKEIPMVFEFLENKKVNCIVIHGCPSDIEKAMSPKTRTYDKHWIPWVKKELIARGIKTETPLMPTPWEPDYEKFKKEFEKYEVNKNTVLIGHSCGSAFLVRWLGETKRKIFKLILVAPWKIPDKNDKFRKTFYEYSIDHTIKSRVKKIIMFTADDEEEEGKESLRIFHQALDGGIIELKGRGHYTMKDMGTTEFPELLKIILR